MQPLANLNDANIRIIITSANNRNIFYYKNQKVFQIGKLSKYKTAFKYIVEPTYKQLFKQAVYSTGQIQAYFLNSNPHCIENLPIQNFQVLRHFLFCYG